MDAYFVEGKYIARKNLKKSQKNGRISPADIEPFAQRIFANSPQEALRMADEAIHGGQWVEGPHVGQQTEARHMQAIGAPQLPGFETPVGKPRPASRKK
jgi:hypothetical protein